MSSYGAVSATVYTVPDGKMADFLAFGKNYDLSGTKGWLRAIAFQADANTVVAASIYDTVENCNSRAGSDARVAGLKATADLGVTVANNKGAIVVTMPGAVPRVASDTRVGSYRKIQVKAGQMDAAIALMATPNPEPVMAGRRGGFVVKIDDTTLVTISAYNDQASLAAGDVKGAMPHLDAAEVAKVFDGAGTRMTGPVAMETFASRAAGAVSTHFITVAPGKMDEALALYRAYDVKSAPGRFRFCLTQADANTLVCVTCYDTVESLKARDTSDASRMALIALCTKVESAEGAVVIAASGTGPRTYSDTKVWSTRKMKILPGKMDELIAACKVDMQTPVAVPGHRGAIIIKVDENTLLMHSIYNDQASLDAAAENSKRVASDLAPFMADAGTRVVGKQILDVYA